MSKRSIVYRAAVALLAAAVVCVAGAGCVSCAKQQESAKKAVAARFSKGFSCVAAIQWAGGSYRLQIGRTAKDEYSLAFLAPAALEPLRFSYGNGVLKVGYGGISTAVDPASLPQSALLYSVAGVLGAAAQPQNIHVRTASGGVVVTGKTQAGAFTLTLDRSLTPKTLSVPGIGLTAQFEQFRYG